MVGLRKLFLPGSESSSPHDPWEPFNRSVFEFNEGLDAYLLKPSTWLATVLFLPEFVRDRASTISLVTISDIYTCSCRTCLQGKPDYGL